jgi:hypothetical protein
MLIARPFLVSSFTSPTSEPAGDFRFIDARPEPTSRLQTQPPPAKAAETNAIPELQDASMEVDDDDMKEIAKFLPMLQESSKRYRSVTSSELIVSLSHDRRGSETEA